jgi:hypothetical protein
VGKAVAIVSPRQNQGFQPVNFFWGERDSVAKKNSLVPTLVKWTSKADHPATKNILGKKRPFKKRRSLHRLHTAHWTLEIGH